MSKPKKRKKPAKATEKRSVTVEAEHHFSSMGRTDSYKVGDHNYCYGVPLHAVGFEIGDGDRFRVTVERLPRLSRRLRFPRNPFQRK